nr:unnamed protein product [Callosobruchus analis]
MAGVELVIEEKKDDAVDRQKICPFLLRVFVSNNGYHHKPSEYNKGNTPQNELQIYTWKDATLHELTQLVKEVNPEARRKGTKFNFAFVAALSLTGPPKKKYGIPKSTLEFKLEHPGHKDTLGPSLILSDKEEALLVSWIRDNASKGFPRKANDVKNSVQKFLSANPRPNKFKNNRPGEGWVKGFVKRHPEISKRTSEGVTSGSACVSEQDIKNWFTSIHEYFKQKGLIEVLNDPSRIFNSDESGFQICPSTGKVFAMKGSKNVYAIERGSAKENITVLFTFSADGKKKQELKEEQEKEKENRKRKRAKKQNNKKGKEDYENTTRCSICSRIIKSGDDDDLYLCHTCYKLSDIDEEEVDELYEQYQQERKLYYR